MRLVPLPASARPAWHERAAERRARLGFVPMLGDLEAARAEAHRRLDSGLARHDGEPDAEVMAVVDGDGRGEVLGDLVLRADTEGVLAAVDISLSSPERAAELRRLVVALAGARGCRALVTTAYAADPVDAAFGAGAGFEVSATGMALRLPGGPWPAADRVELVEMSPTAYAAWSEDSIEHYAQERHASGTSSLELERRLSREQFAELLPEGPATPDQELLTVVEIATGGPVGILWLGRLPPVADYVYDVALDDAHRGRGLGRAVMEAAAVRCAQRGSVVLGLNVFGTNAVARSLYDSLGFQVVQEHLTLQLT